MKDTHVEVSSVMPLILMYKDSIKTTYIYVTIIISPNQTVCIVIGILAIKFGTQVSSIPLGVRSYLRIYSKKTIYFKIHYWYHKKS